MGRIFLALTLLAGIFSVQPAYADNRGFISRQLPEWIEVEADFRHRYEFWGDFDFNDKNDDNDGFNLKRTRVSLTLKPHEQVEFFYQFQDSRIDSDETFDSGKSSFENWTDTKRLYLRFMDFFANEGLGVNGISFTVGRIGLKYGDQRLLGDPEWSNVGQSFDGGKAEIVMFDGNLELDIFGAEKVQIDVPRDHDDLFSGDSEDTVIGYYATYRGFELFKTEHYLIHRDTDTVKSFGPSASGKLDEYTIGARVTGMIPDTLFDYELESAYQWGDMGMLDISAWMAVGELGYTFDHEWSPRFNIGFDYASGDPDATDGERNTFDTLYPDSFIHLGSIQRHSLQNVKNYRTGLSLRPSQKLKLDADLGFYFLNTTNDYLYVSSAGRLRAATGADFDRYAGSELDLKANYDVNEYLRFVFGFAHYFAADYLDDTGESDDADLAYVETILSF